MIAEEALSLLAVNIDRVSQDGGKRPVPAILCISLYDFKWASIGLQNGGGGASFKEEKERSNLVVGDIRPCQG